MRSAISFLIANANERRHVSIRGGSRPEPGSVDVRCYDIVRLTAAQGSVTMSQTCCNSDTPSGHKLEGCRIDRAGGHREPTRRSPSPALRQRVRPYRGEDLWGRQEPAS